MRTILPFFALIIIIVAICTHQQVLAYTCPSGPVRSHVEKYCAWPSTPPTGYSPLRWCTNIVINVNVDRGMTADDINFPTTLNAGGQADWLRRSPYWKSYTWSGSAPDGAVIYYKAGSCSAFSSSNHTAVVYNNQRYQWNPSRCGSAVSFSDCVPEVFECVGTTTTPPGGNCASLKRSTATDTCDAVSGSAYSKTNVDFVINLLVDAGHPSIATEDADTLYDTLKTRGWTETTYSSSCADGTILYYKAGSCSSFSSTSYVGACFSNSRYAWANSRCGASVTWSTCVPKVLAPPACATPAPPTPVPTTPAPPTPAPTPAPPTSCNSGYYLKNSQCTICDRGYRCTNGITRTGCSQGTYQDQYGQTTCKTCACAQYSFYADTTCWYCSSGQYAPAGASSCSTCPSGQRPTSSRCGCENIPTTTTTSTTTRTSTTTSTTTTRPTTTTTTTPTTTTTSSTTSTTRPTTTTTSTSTTTTTPTTTSSTTTTTPTTTTSSTTTTTPTTTSSTTTTTATPTTTTTTSTTATPTTTTTTTTEPTTTTTSSSTTTTRPTTTTTSTSTTDAPTTAATSATSTTTTATPTSTSTSTSTTEAPTTATSSSSTTTSTTVGTSSAAPPSTTTTTTVQPTTASSSASTLPPTTASTSTESPTTTIETTAGSSSISSTSSQQPPSPSSTAAVITTTEEAPSSTTPHHKKTATRTKTLELPTTTPTSPSSPPSDQYCPRAPNGEICSNHGACSAPNYVCICDSPFHGPTCNCTAQRCRDTYNVYAVCNSTSGGCMCAGHRTNLLGGCNDCETGYYGPQCVDMCPCGAGVGCDRVTGRCAFGGRTRTKTLTPQRLPTTTAPPPSSCETGWYGPLCQSRCPCATGVACDRQSGHCNGGGIGRRTLTQSRTPSLTPLNNFSGSTTDHGAARDDPSKLEGGAPGFCGEGNEAQCAGLIVGLLLLLLLIIFLCYRYGRVYYRKIKDRYRPQLKVGEYMTFQPKVMMNSDGSKPKSEGLKRVEADIDAGNIDVEGGDVGNESFFAQLSFAMQASDAKEMRDIMADNSVECL